MSILSLLTKKQPIVFIEPPTQPVKQPFAIVIDAEDWYNEYLAEEPNISDQDAIIATQMERGIGPQKLGRLCVIGNERGDVAEGEFPASKLLLQTGAAFTVSSILARRMKAVEVNGKSYNAREFIAPVYQDLPDVTQPDTAEAAKPELLDGAGTSFVKTVSPFALERATRYLVEKVPGYVWGRLLIVAANDGDVQQVADELKRHIDEMVTKLT